MPYQLKKKGQHLGKLKLGINGNLPMPSGMRKVVSQIRKRWPRRFILLSAGGLYVISVKCSFLKEEQFWVILFTFSPMLFIN